MGIACGAFPSALTSPGAPAPRFGGWPGASAGVNGWQGGLGGRVYDGPAADLASAVRSQVATIAPWVELGDAAQSLLGELAADLPGVGIRMVTAADRLAQALGAVPLDRAAPASPQRPAGSRGPWSALFG